MAKLLAMPEQAIIDGFKGTLDFYYWKGIPCVRKWPTWRPYTFSQEQRDNQAAFAYISHLWSVMDPTIKALWIEMAGGTSLTGRDMAIRSYLKGTNA